MKDIYNNLKKLAYGDRLKMKVFQTDLYNYIKEVKAGSKQAFKDYIIDQYLENLKMDNPEMLRKISELNFIFDLNALDFSGQDFTNCDFSELTLINKSFYKSNLENVKFDNSNLTKVDFTNAQLKNVDFTTALIQDAIFTDSNRDNTKFTKKDNTEFVKIAKIQDTVRLVPSQQVLKNYIHAPKLGLKQEFKDYIVEDYLKSFPNANANEINEILSKSIIEIDFSKIDFSGLNLKGLNFNGLNLKGKSFENSNLEGAYFASANLENSNFKGANLRGVSFDKAKGIKNANFEQANLYGAYVDNSYSNSSFKKAKFQPLNYKAKIQTVKIADFDHYLYNLKFNSELTFVQHVKTIYNLQGEILVDASNIDFSKTNLNNFNNCNFERVNFTGCKFTGCTFENTNLEDAYLVGAKLNNCIIKNSNLFNADLRNAKISNSDIINNDLGFIKCENTVFESNKIVGNNTSNKDHILINQQSNKSIILGEKKLDDNKSLNNISKLIDRLIEKPTFERVKNYIQTSRPYIMVGDVLNLIYHKFLDAKSYFSNKFSDMKHYIKSKIYKDYKRFPVSENEYVGVEDIQYLFDNITEGEIKNSTEDKNLNNTKQETNAPKAATQTNANASVSAGTNDFEKVEIFAVPETNEGIKFEADKSSPSVNTKSSYSARTWPEYFVDKADTVHSFVSKFLGSRSNENPVSRSCAR